MHRRASIISVIGLIFDHEKVLEMVCQGKIWGYAYEAGQGKLSQHCGNVWSGPEIGWVASESITRNRDLWIESMIRALKGIFLNKIN